VRKSQFSEEQIIVYTESEANMPTFPQVLLSAFHR
jgi:hypothetical protein